MLFVEFRFFVFLLVVFVVSWSLRSDTRRKSWLLACSYAFYAAWNWAFLSLILISTFVDYGVGLALDGTDDRRRRRLLLTLSVCVNLGILGFFKYFGFFVDSAVDLLALFGLEANPRTLDVLLPVGISFYTFQTMSYSLDVYFGKLRSTRNLLDFALFVAFFPQLVAGPIVRARDFLPQLARRPAFASVRFRPALLLFMIGFFKKACVSDNVAPYVDAYFAAPDTFDWASSWIASFLYSVQIYCDFSGYSDMAIATAALLGYRLCINFRHPLLSGNVSDLWRRWHISLSSWLRDYLYIPLGGNRGSKWFTRRNLMLTMGLGGLWHGAAWTFVAWGVAHGCGLIVHQWWRAKGRPLATPVGVALTFLFFNLTFIVFRAPDWAAAWTAVRAYATFTSPGARSLPPELWLVFGVLAAVHVTAYRGTLNRAWERVPTPVFAAAYGLAAQICIMLMPTGYRPFIYFQF